MNKGNIDVSKCMYFRMNNKMPMCRACYSGVGSPYCEYHKDCYYRQLKRLQAENERLKQTLQEIKDITEEDCKQCFEIDGFSKPDDCGICPYNKILQKITKAEE